MKKLIFILFISVILSSEYSDKYYKSMDRALELFNSSETEEEFLKASNYFYRISQVGKTDWLSSYYYAFSNTMISMEQDDPDIKAEYLDKALSIIEPYDSLGFNNIDSLALSEIYTLKGMIYIGKIFINPMVNGMKYGPLSGKSVQKAIKYYPNNPRPYFLDGQSKFYTPSAFGGGVDKSLPLLEKSLQYYKEFQARDYWPDWGEDDCQSLYDKALDDSK